jgi:hypothetical protein
MTDKPKYEHRTLRAVFHGKDGSLGYRRGNIYRLLLQKIDGSIKITCFENRSGTCVYSSERNFLFNWTLRVVVIEKTGHSVLKI